jgi:hypothetical protein
MNVFISWSGEISNGVAQILHWWLPCVLQSIKPYLSTEDIEMGARWSHEVAHELEETNFGIICVSHDNIGSPWLNFEAGALSKSVGLSRVSPFLFGLDPIELTGPLAQFQATRNEAKDIIKLVQTLNSLSEKPIETAQLEHTIRVWLPQLSDRFQELSRKEARRAPQSKRELRDLIEEVLELTRSIQRQAIINPGSQWVTYAPSSGEGGMEVADLNEFVVVRDAKNRSRAAELYTKHEWHAFLQGVLAGEFDLPKDEEGKAK